MSEKDELLDDMRSIITPNEKLDLKYLLYVLLSLTFIITLLLPKVYIQKEIYYKSRDIAKLQIEYSTLKEENKIISASVESIRFKNQILDTLF